MSPISRKLTCILLLLTVLLGTTDASPVNPEIEEVMSNESALEQSLAKPNILSFAALLSTDETESREALNALDSTWNNSYVAPILDILSLSNGSRGDRRILSMLTRNTGQSFRFDTGAWFEWMWKEEVEPVKDYALFKSWLFGKIDPKFSGYFKVEYQKTIRLDEVRWGGVRQDGIPPLRYPKMISANAAAYLRDKNIVFAFEINGDYRAYPKRIMGWHEMFVDEVGGVNVAGVYCTLCGSMIIYETEHKGTQYHLGTSGFLYRSNKLMYDKKTQSLWSTLRGNPVIGPLVGKGIRLKAGSVVTTTWGEWRRRHPETTVLALDTGYSRNYGEGVAYRSYFATDKLMFNVSKVDNRLKNKAEVLGLNTRDADDPLAISVKYLSSHPLEYQTVGDQRLLILTDKSGASRVFETGIFEFVDWDRDNVVTDKRGVRWTLSESKLSSADGQSLKRYPAHRAFWFGWFAAYTDTRLVL